jgi:hypothetical protein
MNLKKGHRGIILKMLSGLNYQRLSIMPARGKIIFTLK